MTEGPIKDFDNMSAEVGFGFRLARIDWLRREGSEAAEFSRSFGQHLEKFPCRSVELPVKISTSTRPSRMPCADLLWHL